MLTNVFGESKYASNIKVSPPCTTSQLLHSILTQLMPSLSVNVSPDPKVANLILVPKNRTAANSVFI